MFNYNKKAKPDVNETIENSSSKSIVPKTNIMDILFSNVGIFESTNSQSQEERNFDFTHQYSAIQEKNKLRKSATFKSEKLNSIRYNEPFSGKISDITLEKINEDYGMMVEHFIYIYSMFIDFNAVNNFALNISANHKNGFTQVVKKLCALIETSLDLNIEFDTKFLEKMDDNARLYLKENNYWYVGANDIDATALLLNEISYDLMQSNNSHEKLNFIVYLMENNVVYKLSLLNSDLKKYFNSNKSTLEKIDCQKILLAKKYLDEINEVLQNIFLQVVYDLDNSSKDNKIYISKISNMTPQDILLQSKTYKNMSIDAKNKEQQHIIKRLNEFKKINMQLKNNELDMSKFSYLSFDNLNQFIRQKNSCNLQLPQGLGKLSPRNKL